jgi:hypothetical protein
MQNAAAMSDDQFDQAIQNFINQFFSQNLDGQSGGADGGGDAPRFATCPAPACKQ